MKNECLSAESFKRFVSFEKLIAPCVVRTLFWIVAFIVLCLGLKVMIKDNFVAGMLILVLGPILVRVVAEFLLMGFKIHDLLIEVRDGLQKNASGRKPAA